MIIPKLVKCKEPSMLYADVLVIIHKSGGDLFDGMFVDYEGNLCQWVLVGSFSMYEYYLVQASSIDDLELTVRNLHSLGWEPYNSTVLYEGDYVQWMCRLKAVTGEQYAVASNQFSVVEELVVGEPLFSSWRNPFVVN